MTTKMFSALTIRVAKPTNCIKIIPTLNLTSSLLFPDLCLQCFDSIVYTEQSCFSSQAEETFLSLVDRLVRKPLHLSSFAQTQYSTPPWKNTKQEIISQNKNDLKAKIGLVWLLYLLDKAFHHTLQPFHSASLVKLLQSHNGDSSKLWKRYVEAPVSKVVSKKLNHREDTLFLEVLGL